LHLEYYIAKRITFQSKRTFSKTIVRIGISAIAISIAVILISVAIVKGFQKEIKNKVIGFGAHIQISSSQINYTYENAPIWKDDRVIDRIKRIPQVKQIQIFATKSSIVRVEDLIEGFILKGVSSDYDWQYIQKHLVAGTILNLNDSLQSNEILISQKQANKLKLETGDMIHAYFVQKPPRVRKFKVAGIYETNIEDIDDVFALIDIRHIQRLNGWGDSIIGGYEVLLHDLDDLYESNHTIRHLVDIEQDTKTIVEMYPQIFDWLNLLNINIKIILILMTLVAAVNMITALMIIILEKTHFIAIMKTMGAPNVSIGKIFMITAAFLIAGGIAIGNILGLGLLFLQDTFQIIELPRESYSVSHVPVLFSWGTFIVFNLATFVFCSLVMIIPASIIARMRPVKSLRFE
jgi:lipoprotein-releasing system permease protein